MSAGNTPPRPEEGKEDRPKAETDKAQKISDTAEQRSGPGPTGPGGPESKSGPEALGTPAAKPTSPPGAAAAASSAASAAATPAAKAAAAEKKPAPEPEIRDGRQIAGGLAMKKGEKANKEEVIAKALEKIRATEKALAERKRPEMTRRALFMKTGWLGFSAFMAFMGGCFARFFFPRVLFEPAAKFKAGYPGEYTVGEVSTKYKDTNRVWIVREATGFYAIFARCTHLGCTPMWLEGEQKFKCPCHGSGYTKEAINYEGPAPRPMERCQITLSDDGQILIDTSTRFRYEKGEWDRAGAYLRA
jgi:cytochrome b6-f complex iron-sulfur subunit